jgi:hypothetical protein
MNDRKLDTCNGNERDNTFKYAVADNDIQIKIVTGVAIFIATTMGFICGYKAANVVNERIQDSILSYLKNEQN